MAENQKTLEILLKAKAEVDAAFRAVEDNVKALDDKVKKHKTGFAGFRQTANDFFKDNEESFKSIGKALGLAAGGVVAVAGGIGALGIRGSTVLGIKSSFDALALSVGDTGDEIVRVTKGATKGLISDMDIMSSVNKGILLGLPLTSGEMGTLAEVAVVLGKAMKIGPVEALNDLITGLGRGSPLILDNLGITVNATEAYKAYATSIGKSADALTDNEKKLAIYRSALDSAKVRVQELGGIHLSFADKVQIGRVMFQNLIDDFAKAVATSPVVNRAMEVIAGGITEAFGQNKQDTISLFMGWVNRAAILLVDFAKVAVEGARWITFAWDSLKAMFAGVMTGITLAVEGIVKGWFLLFQAAAKIPIVGDKLKPVVERFREASETTEAWRRSFHEQTGEAVENAKRHHAAFDSISGGLSTLKGEMIKAAAAGAVVAASNDNVTRSADDTAAAVDVLAKQKEDWKKKVLELNAALEGAAGRQVSHTRVLEEYGTQIEEVVRQAEIFGLRVPKAIRDAFDVAQARKFGEVMDHIRNKTMETSNRMTEEFRKANLERAQVLNESLAASVVAQSDYEEKLLDLTRTGAERRLAALERERREAIGKLGAPPAGMEAQWKRSTDAINAYYDQLLADARDMSSQVAGEIGNLANLLADQFGGIFGSLVSTAMAAINQIVAQSTDKFSGLAGFMNSKLGKGIGIGAGAFGGGFSAGAQHGTGKGAAAGALSGAATGAAAGSVIPGIGTAIGAGVGAVAGFIGGIFGGKKKKKQDAEELKNLQKDLVATFGSMANLEKAASSVGVSIDKAFSTKKPEEAKKVIQELNDALEAQQKRLEGIATATEGLNAKVTGAQERLAKGGAAAVEEFKRLDTFTSAVFAAQVKETGDMFGALAALEPSLAILSDAQKNLGVEGSKTLTGLLGFRETVTVNKDVADSVQSLNQLMKGLGEAGVTNKDLFAAFGEDAGAQIRTMAERGVDVNQQMMMMQPTLQALWEGQKKFGAVTDESTAALLKQAEEQGIVGSSMQSVNQKMLDVLLAIGDALGATIPDALRNVEKTSKESFGGVANDADMAGVAIKKSIPGALQDTALVAESTRKQVDESFRGMTSIAVEAAAGILTNMDTAFAGIKGQAQSAAASVRTELAGISIDPIAIPFFYQQAGDGPGGGGGEQGFAVGGTVPFTPGGRVVRVAERETERIVSDDQLAAIVARALAAAGGSTRAGQPSVIVKIGERTIREMVVEHANDGLANRDIRVPAGAVTSRSIG